jgi:hypothetical protein
VIVTSVNRKDGGLEPQLLSTGDDWLLNIDMTVESCMSSLGMSR